MKTAITSILAENATYYVLQDGGKSRSRQFVAFTSKVVTVTRRFEGRCYFTLNGKACFSEESMVTSATPR